MADSRIAALVEDGLTHYRAGRLGEAAVAFKAVLRAAPEHPDALHLLGVVAHDAGDNGTALKLIERAIRAKPASPTFHNNLGIVLRESGRPAEAEAACRRAIGMKPDLAEGHFQLGNAVNAQGRVDEALAAYQRAIALRPDYMDPHNNLGITLKRLGRLDEAAATLRRATEISPDAADAHKNLGMCLLLMGDWAEGWREYEWRRRTGELEPRDFAEPEWDGGALDGKTILLHAEQGLGDTIQFVRYAPLVRDRGGRVIVECDARLARLLASVDGVERVVAKGAPMPGFDVQASLLGLPLRFATTEDSIPAALPYMVAPREAVETWRRRIGHDDRIRVGLAWAGRKEHKEDRYRSIPLDAFRPLMTIANMKFYSLQVGERAADVAAEALGDEVEDLTPALDDFSDSAAALAALDLLVSVDTSTAHLAGALGRPVWVLIASAPDWRWMTGREDSPWYPSMRLFRQEAPGEWAPVIERLRGELCALAAGEGSAA